MKGFVIFLNIFLVAFALSVAMRDIGIYTIRDLPLLVLGIVCLLSAYILIIGQPILKRPFVKKGLITLNLLAVGFALFIMIVDTEGRMGEFSLVVLILTSLLNSHILVVQKNDWSDRLLARPFFAKKKLLKAIALPVAVLILLSIPTDLRGYSYVWPNVKGYAYFKYDPDWTGVHISESGDYFGVSHPSEYVKRAFKTKEECIQGRPDFGPFENPNNIYICGKKCLYDDFGYGFCLQRH